MTANLSVQLSFFRLHLHTQSTELGQAVTLISFNKQKWKNKHDYSVLWWDIKTIDSVKILFKKSLTVSYYFSYKFMHLGISPIQNCRFHLPSPKEISEYWNGSSSNVFIIRWTLCTKTVTWQLEKTCVKCQSLEWLIAEVYKFGNQQYSNYYNFQIFLCSYNPICYFLWKAEFAAWSKTCLFSRTASSQFPPIREKNPKPQNK